MAGMLLLAKRQLPISSRGSSYLKTHTRLPASSRMFAIHPPPRSKQLPTFTHQRTLPKLPVPSLRSSLDRYLTSIEPLLAQEEEHGRGVASKELEKRRQWAQEFENGLGKVLQERLIDLDRTSPNNWLNDNYWIKKAYHEWRAPLVINSNWWLLFHDDVTLPQDVRQGLGPGNGQFSDWQIRRASWLVGRFVDFKEKLEKQEIHPDSSRTGPFCMHQYTRLYSMCRVPGYGCDSVTQPASKSSKEGRSITVMLKDWIYTVEIYDKAGVVATPQEIEQRLQEVVRDVQQREARGEKATQVGILTADERDTWAKNREHLIGISPQNRATLTAIEGSIFTLCLDDHTLPPRTSTVAPQLTRPDIDAQVWNCASGGPSGANRWYDKALTVMVESNGRAGMMGEHSPCDALIPSIIVDYAVAEPVNLEAYTESAGRWTLDDGSEPRWSRLGWVTDETLNKEILESSERAKQVIADSEPSQLWFSEYGAEWMKNVAKQSPDAYIQMALQLAWYKDQGSMTATYETASTRLFAHGRTDVIRTLTNDSRAFVKAMVDPSSSPETRRDLLTKAVSSHNTYTRDASTGKGIDRHMMGLRLLQRPGESSPLLDDPVFSKSAEWKLSTSGLSAGTRFFGTGFGTVWPDGYGINYLAGPHLIKFGIESKKSCTSTSTHRFKSLVVESLGEMRSLFGEAGLEDATVTAKL